MSVPVIIKQAADAAVKNMENMAKRQLEAEKLIPSYKEMRAAKLHPDMTERERMAYRNQRIQKGYMGGTIGGGVLGGLAGTTRGALLNKTRFGKNMPGATAVLKRYVLPATIGYTGYRMGAIQGRRAGEAIARKKLTESGNPIPYINPISLTDRGAADPVFMAGMMGAKTLQSAISEKSREKVEKQILGTAPRTHLRQMFKTDAGTMKKILGQIRQWRK
jgi:hypothetical protein